MQSMQAPTSLPKYSKTPIVLALLFLASACGDHGVAPSAAGPAASVSITVPAGFHALGQTVNFAATVRNAGGQALQSFPVSWSSDDPTIVNITTDGFARAVGVGTTILHATVGSLTAATTVTVAGDPVVSISLNPGSKALSIGQSVQFAATLRDYNGAVVTGRPVVWASNDPSVVSVDSLGSAKALADGQAAVTATSAGIQATAFVTVGADTLPGKVSDLSASVLNDSTVTLSFTTVGDGLGHPASYDVRYHSHPIRWGSASEVVSGSCTSPLRESTIGTQVTCTASGLDDGTPYDFQLVAFRGIPNVDATFGPLSNLAIVSTPAGPGTPTSTGSGTQGSSAVAASIRISPSTLTDTVGQGSQLFAVVKDSAGNVLSGHAVEWWTTDSSVVGVSPSGYATAKGVGTASVIATSDGATGRAQMTVKLPPPPPTVASISVTPATASLTAGYRMQLTATAYDASGASISNVGFSWSSSASAVATVNSSGLISAVGVGTATITASVGGKSGTATVSVTAALTGSTSGGEPKYNSSTGKLIFSDNMDEYTSLAAMQSYSGPNMFWKDIFVSNDPAEQLLSPGSGGTGHALRQSYAGTYQETHTFDLMNAPSIPDTATEFFSYDARVTIQSPGISQKTLAIKWVMFFHRNGTRIEFDTHDHLPCPLNSPSGNSVWQVFDQSLTTCQGDQPVGPYPAQAFDGQWHRYTYEYKPNSAPGARDGIARMWVDGVKVIDISASAVGVTPAGGWKPWCGWDDVDHLSTEGVDMVRWAGNLTTSTPPFTIDWDNFTWWTAR